MNICVQCFMWICFYFSGMNAPKCNYRAVQQCMLSLVKTDQLFLLLLYCFALLAALHERSSFSTFLPELGISSVQFSHSVVSDFATPWIATHQASLSITNSRSSLKLMSIESVMFSSHIILCRPPCIPIPPSIRVFSNESTLCMRWPKYWSFSFSIIPSKEIPELISFRMDWKLPYYRSIISKS